MSVVKVDDKGRVLLSKEVRKASGIEKNDRLIAKLSGKGKILLEKPSRQHHSKDDPLDWLLSHPAKIHSTKLKDEVKRGRSTLDLLENWKEELWTGD